MDIQPATIGCSRVYGYFKVYLDQGLTVLEPEGFYIMLCYGWDLGLNLHVYLHVEWLGEK